MSDRPILRDPARLAAMRRTALLESPPLAAFDRLTRLATTILHAPVALVTLVDAERQVFVSCVGLPEPWASTRETPLSHSFCQHTLASGEPLVIADARTHPLVRDNRAIPDLGVIAYAGIPLVTAAGDALGSFCVIDHVPRIWAEEEIAILTDLAASVMTEIELRASDAERARLLTEAERARARLQQVIDVLPEGILIADAAGRVIRANRAAEDLLGADVVGRSMVRAERAAARDDLTRLDGTPYPDGELPLERSLGRGEEVRGVQLLLRRAGDGDDIPALLNSAPLRDAAEVINGAVVVFQDITTIKNFERARDDLLATVAHDLKNPLTAIQGLAELTQQQAQRAGTPSNERIAVRQESIVTAATQMTALLDELLDAMQLEMGQPLALERHPTDLVALVRRVVDHQREIAERPLRVDAPTATLVCEVDAERIERVAGNLIANAIKYSPEGAEVTVQVADVREGEGAWAVLTVADRGRGIPAEDLPHVFDRFYRAENVGRTQGAGIGLASVREIVEQHGGTVAVASAEGTGTIVTVRLPLAEAPGSQKAGSAAEQA